MTTFARIAIGQCFKLRRNPDKLLIKIDFPGANAQNIATGEQYNFGPSTKVLLPPYDELATPRPVRSIWLDGVTLPYSVTPFMQRQMKDLSALYDNPSALVKDALFYWRVMLKADGESDMQALCSFTGLRPQEVIELAMYDAWRRWKGL